MLERDPNLESLLEVPGFQAVLVQLDEELTRMRASVELQPELAANR